MQLHNIFLNQKGVTPVVIVITTAAVLLAIFIALNQKPPVSDFSQASTPSC